MHGPPSGASAVKRLSSVRCTPPDPSHRCRNRRPGIRPGVRQTTKNDRGGAQSTTGEVPGSTWGVRQFAGRCRDPGTRQWFDPSSAHCDRSRLVLSSSVSPRSRGLRQPRRSALSVSAEAHQPPANPVSSKADVGAQRTARRSAFVRGPPPFRPIHSPWTSNSRLKSRGWRPISP